MFSLKCLTKKFNRQSLSEVKPAPLSETVDHTSSSSSSSPSSLSLSSKSTSTSFSPCTPSIYNTVSSRTTTNTTTFPVLSPPPPPTQQQQHDSNTISTASTATNTDHTSSGMSTLSLQDHPNHFTRNTTSAEPENEDGIVDDPSCNNDDDNDVGSTHFLPSSPAAAVSSSSGESLSPSSPISSSDSEDEDTPPPPLRVKARPHSPRKSPLQSQLKIERISSAEKRKYSQYKCSTGGSSSPSSSDDEIKEAFDPSSTSRSRHHYLHPHHHHHNLTYSPPSIPHHPTAWGSGSTKQGPSPFNSPSLVPTSPSSALSDPHHHNHHSPLSGWGATTAGVDPFEAAGRPLKVLPVGRHKHKFFAQMSSGFDRPFLDFNKMQHSKRLVMVRRPMVIRNNSRVHSIQRPAPSSLQVSLDISQHCFQPVLS